MFRNVRVDGEIKIFSYNKQNFLVSVNDINTKREYKFWDIKYLNLIHHNMALIKPDLFGINTHRITVSSEQKITSVWYKDILYHVAYRDFMTGNTRLEIKQDLPQNTDIDQNLFTSFTEQQITYDAITESIFNSIINFEHISIFDTVFFYASI